MGFLDQERQRNIYIEIHIEKGISEEFFRLLGLNIQNHLKFLDVLGSVQLSRTQK